MNSLKQINQENQLPTELKETFIELKVLKHLRQAGIKRNLGFACSYIFQIVFCLLFQHRNWFRLQESERKNVNYPSKDAIYRFLNCPNFAWQRFLSSFSSHVIEKVIPLKEQKQTRVLIVDDSAYERNRSKKVELLARCRDHNNNAYYKGFRMLTSGWSDGHTLFQQILLCLVLKPLALMGLMKTSTNAATVINADWKRSKKHLM